VAGFTPAHGWRSATLTVDVVSATPFDFTMTISPGLVTVKQGETANYRIIISYSDPSYSGTVINVVIAGLSPDMSYSLTPAGGLSIRTSTSTPPGTYPFTIKGSARGVVHSTTANLVVEAKLPPFTYDLTVSPSTQTVNLGQKTTYTVSVNLLSGASETVSLTVSGLPSDVAYTIAPPSASPTYTSTLTIDTSSASSTGTYTITITSSGGGMAKTATAT
ncbi:MAG: hypothetical protein FGF53_09965, partial [Candidatus Brockarchaeota archaeon]|nr:hypothetical protein [Candidatus Brockarchaeota archaeon]